jgi:hypothetical protein
LEKSPECEIAGMKYRLKRIGRTRFIESPIGERCAALSGIRRVRVARERFRSTRCLANGNKEDYRRLC